MRIAQRAERIEPFYVMEVAKAASVLAAKVAHTADPMIFLNIGEPDFTAPPLVQEAATRAIHDGATQYTQATGLWQLREKISGWYASRFKVEVAPSRIIITAGASAALQLACLALIEAGDEILMPRRSRLHGTTRRAACCWHHPRTPQAPQLRLKSCSASMNL